MPYVASEVAPPLPPSAHRRAQRAVHAGRWQELLAQGRRLQADYPGAREPTEFVIEAHRRLGQFDELRQVLVGMSQSQSFGNQLRLVDAHIHCGDIDQAMALLNQLEVRAGSNPSKWAQLAERHAHLGQHQSAHACHRRSVDLAPDRNDLRYNLATSLLTVGELSQAEQQLDRVIQSDYADGDAWYARSTLRRQQPAHNHVEGIAEALRQHGDRPSTAIALHYAHGKELEDLGRHHEAFSAFSRGAAIRKHRLGYRVEQDVLAMQHITRSFGSRDTVSPSGDRGNDRIFVVGLPRTGTTLVDRILSSHSDVASLGETSDLALSVLRTVGRTGRWSGNKLQLIDMSARVDPALIGDEYLRATGQYPAGTRVRLDKTPLNFLYLGLIRRALPGARIIHVRRHPVDSAFAMFKTLFRMGYPFSYDLDDLATYILAHDALMEHWRSTHGEDYLEVHYEDLVAEPETQTGRLAEFCGLEIQNAMRDFHRNPSPSATASAAQVREPIHSGSVNRWRHHRDALAPLIERLARHGMEFPL